MTDPQLAKTPFHPRGVPLITHDSDFSVWSMAERLTDDAPRQWTGTERRMCGLVRIDGVTYRFMGAEPESIPAMEQVSLEVLPLHTVYRFEAAGISLTLTFLSPLLPSDLDLLARPVTYVTWDGAALDGQTHAVELYFDCSMEWCVDNGEQEVFWGRSTAGELTLLHCGSVEQPVLQKAGDDQRIDWGYFYLAPPTGEGATAVIASGSAARENFCRDGKLLLPDEVGAPRPISQDAPVMSAAFDLGRVGEKPVSRRIMLAYDDVFSIEYMGQKLRPYWRRGDSTMEDLLVLADGEYPSVLERCLAFETELLPDLERVGGIPFRRLGSLAVRTCLAGAKLVEAPDGTPWLFSKEHYSNGCVSTVDVTYPTSPFYLLFNPELLKAALIPVLEYARSDRWPFPFAPHDLGTYPRANGQVYGGGEKTLENQMPVEECGNMLLMAAALAQIETTRFDPAFVAGPQPPNLGATKTGTIVPQGASFAAEYWPLLSEWANYLVQCGMDPANQLCTDDFAGRLTRNANLSLKSILALGAYAKLAAALGHHAEATDYRRMAEEMVPQWMDLARDEDHYSLTFENPGTWSQKYNLAWDTILRLNLFPPEVARTEIAYYKRQMKPFGVPLDSRHGYTKLDWTVWTATLAESPEDFRRLLAPAYRFAAESPTRVPIPDRYWTEDGSQAGRTRARSVVGGVMMPMLKDEELWRKWAGRRT